MSSLRERIEFLAARDNQEWSDEDRAVFAQFKQALNRGEVRAAEPATSGAWQVQLWVKRGILLGFRMGILTDMSASSHALNQPRFFDKDTYPLRTTTLEDNVRIVPGGSSIRDGAYVAPSVVCMPPMYINVGAYVDTGTMIDSHALVGSCAQIGKRVHLSAAAQVGGVLEPVGALPVIIEDDCLVGGGCGIYEGTIVRERAVLAPGTILTGSTSVYDLPRGLILRRTADAPLEIPAGAVVVPGSRAVATEQGRDWGLSLYTPVIVKYRDERTDAATLLEDALR
ncbi:MAG: 2,3,4,5-tetrahydropyridine-2,6-dicarboxylate N-succinyltransferase [Pyrinomonadaceae bacterium]|nr:2,3,4,5-tetrahydropyridine-2,6-dicarboxylate N-succinyltransferase [Pyrinomonadaceae bacterium]